MIRLHILSHADYAGEIRRDNGASGLDYFKKAVDAIRKKDPDHTLLLDAGDNFQHLLWDDFISGEILWLEEDAFCLGNHEFDKGEAELERRISLISDRVKVLCANIVKKEDGSLIKGVRPYSVFTKGGVTYGILGLCTEYTPYMVTAPMIEPFRVLDSAECARKYIPEMRDKGAEVIIVLTHFPFYEDCTGELFDVFEKIKDLKPDVMIGGHIPGDIAVIREGCAITKAGFGGKSLGHAVLDFDEEKRLVTNRTAEILDVYHDQKERDIETTRLLEKVLAPHAYYFEEALAEAETDFRMRLDYESPMGNLLADAVKEETGADFVYFNCTSCGRVLPKGKITRAVIAAAMGFNDELYESVYTGKDIKDLFECVHVPERFGNNGNIFFAGLNVKMDHTRPAGQKVVYVHDEKGLDVPEDREFRVITSEYMASGGNDTGSISQRHDWVNTHRKIHDVLANWFQKTAVIKKRKEGRYPFIGKPENDNSPW